MKKISKTLVCIVLTAALYASCAPARTVVVVPRRPPRAVVVRRPRAVVVARPVTVVRVP